eukprot:SAG11_NODE_11749_length_740_cov_0.989080_2_plen_62_part_01
MTLCCVFMIMAWLTSASERADSSLESSSALCVTVFYVCNKQKPLKGILFRRCPCFDPDFAVV